jgi:hypothetical protein
MTSYYKHNVRKKHMQLLKDDHRLNIFVVIGTTQGDPNSWV